MSGQLSPSARRQVKAAANTVSGFARHFTGINLYPYQRMAADAIVKSVFARDGKTFVLIFSRQSGKDEVLALIYLFLMLRFYELGADIVSAQPTFKPQTINAMERLRKRGANFGRRLTRTAGYIMRLGQSRTCYFSAEPTASQVGATADRLLVLNEAQDIDPALYDKRFSPMAASGYATKVFSGTSWTSSTLLAREKRAALEAEKLDGVQRVFIVDADQVGKRNPLYARHVADEIKKLGRNHPLVRTQYFCEEIDAQVGMFNAARRALMQADQPGHDSPVAGVPYAFLLDVAGQDEARMRTGNLDDDSETGLTNPGRDSVSLTIATIDLSSLETLQAPTFRFVYRQQWTGENHLVIFGKLKSLVESWKPQHIVMDATGVGEGLWALLDKAAPGRVIPVKFSQRVKSELGWRYIAMIETGRVRDCCGGLASSEHRPRPPHEGWTHTAASSRNTPCPPHEGRTNGHAEQSPTPLPLPGEGRTNGHAELSPTPLPLPQEGQIAPYDKVLAQYLACQAEILPGPTKILRWGVPEGARGTDGELIHDDYLLADALVAEIDRLDWVVATEARTVQNPDPLLSMERNF